jgi:hypothetical protein
LKLDNHSFFIVVKMFCSKTLKNNKFFMYAFAYYILQQPSFIKDKTGGSNNLRTTEWRREKHSAETAMADGGAVRLYSDTVVVVERSGGICHTPKIGSSGSIRVAGV